MLFIVTIAEFDKDSQVLTKMYPKKVRSYIDQNLKFNNKDNPDNPNYHFSCENTRNIKELNLKLLHNVLWSLVMLHKIHILTAFKHGPKVYFVFKSQQIDFFKYIVLSITTALT